jgi:hypothetical protein
MTLLFENLTRHEQEELLNALRRDMRHQKNLSLSNSTYAEWHGHNTRNVIRILECLNPKSSPALAAISDISRTTDNRRNNEKSIDAVVP